MRRGSCAPVAAGAAAAPHTVLAGPGADRALAADRALVELLADLSVPSLLALPEAAGSRRRQRKTERR